MKGIRRLVVGALTLLALGALPRTAAAQDYECTKVTIIYQRIVVYSDGSQQITTYTTVARIFCRPI